MKTPAKRLFWSSRAKIFFQHFDYKLPGGKFLQLNFWWELLNLCLVGDIPRGKDFRSSVLNTHLREKKEHMFKLQHAQICKIFHSHWTQLGALMSSLWTKQLSASCAHL